MGPRWVKAHCRDDEICGSCEPMVVVCKECGENYDDVYRLTYCPHELFEMHTVAVNAEGEMKCCHSLEELHEHMKWGH